MRTVLVVSLVALLCPAALAQTAPAPTKTAASAAPRRHGDVTREQYVARAKRYAQRRFDRMDTDHDGVLTAAERRAYREAHRRHHASPTH